METLSVREYRNNLSSAFDRADQGEQVLIRRKNTIYTLQSVGREDLIFTSKLQKKLVEAEKNLREGKCISCTTPEELDAYFNNL